VTNYTNAVDYLHTMLQLMSAVWKDEKYPDVEANVTQAFKTLTENPFYEGEKKQVN